MQKSSPSNPKNDLLDKMSLIKENMTMRTGRKYTGTTLTQNFFANKLQEDDFLPVTQSYTMAVTRKNKLQQTPPAVKEHEARRSLRKSRKKMEQAVLQPMKQEERVDIYSSATLNNNSAMTVSNIGDIQEFFFSSPQREQQQKSHINETAKRSSRRKSLHKQSNKQEEIMFQKIVEPRTSQKTSRHNVINLANIAEDLLFSQKQEEVKKQNQQKKEPLTKFEIVQEQVFKIPKREFTHEFNEEDDEPEVPSSLSPANKPQSVLTGSDFFNYEDENQLISQIFTQVPENVTLQMQITRNKDGLNTFWPEFHLRFTADRKRVISAKKTSSRASPTFIISRNQYIFQENSHQFMGKVKSTALGEAYNIFGPGLNPANAKERREEPRELIATLAYATSLFQTGGPRRFTLYQLQPGVRYYRDFAQVTKYGEEVPLNVLHALPGNRGKIRVLHSRKPVLVEDSYILNFRGMAPCPSVKNFILEDESVGREVVLFGKQDDSTFNLDVSAGISPYVAFAIALANFDNRLTFQ